MPRLRGCNAGRYILWWAGGSGRTGRGGVLRAAIEEEIRRVGAMDLYRSGPPGVIVDFKTQDLMAEGAAAEARKYRLQAATYRAVVRGGWWGLERRSGSSSRTLAWR